MIAAFTDDDNDLDLAEVLTQEQADSVRKYLVEKHGIDSAGWFRSRKVAAVGFGTQVPAAPGAVRERSFLPAGSTSSCSRPRPERRHWRMRRAPHRQWHSRHLTACHGLCAGGSLASRPDGRGDRGNPRSGAGVIGTGAWWT